MFSNRNKWYWVCQLIGWTLFFIFSLVMMTVFSPDVGSGVVANQLLITGTMFGLSHAFRWYLNKYQWFEKYSSVGLVGRLLVGNIAITILMQLIVTPMIVYVIGAPGNFEYKPIYSIGYAANALVIFIIWTSLYAAIKFIRRYKQSEIARLNTELELQKAEMIALKAQINPHFLFNALNVIRSLINTDTDKARESITKLSNLLRYAIRFQGKELVTLAEELEIVKGYVMLEKTQLEDRLQVNWKVDNELLEKEIPAMTLQMLVENSIKHGIANSSKGGVVEIVVRQEAEKIHVEVINTGKLNGHTSEHESLGLENVNRRLKHLLGEDTLFNLSEENNKVKAEIIWTE